MLSWWKKKKNTRKSSSFFVVLHQLTPLYILKISHLINFYRKCCSGGFRRKMRCCRFVSRPVDTTINYVTSSIRKTNFFWSSFICCPPVYLKKKEIQKNMIAGMNYSTKFHRDLDGWNFYVKKLRKVENFYFPLITSWMFCTF
jgi:hypothetical protein